MKTKKLYWDMETYSETPITRGTHAYAEEARILLVAYAFDDQPVKVWDSTENHEIPRDLYDAWVSKSVLKVGFNSGMFDSTVLRHVRGINIPPEQQYDVMVQALAHALPGKLDTLCEVMGVSEDKAKLKTGKQLINLFCKPRPKNMKLRRATRETHPEEWAMFIEYARNDVEATRELHNKVPKWNYVGEELRLWHLDQHINSRGFRIDVPLAEAALRAVDIAQASLSKEVDSMTGGEVSSANQRDALMEHILSTHGIRMKDMRADTVERMVAEGDLPPEVQQLLEIRLQSSKTSTAKYKKLIEAASSDGRLRGTLQFNGAGRTRRWAGRTFQPQNLPRPSHKQKEIDLFIEALYVDCLDVITDDVMGATSSTIRGCIIAEEGNKLIATDLSNIEGRFAAWVAGETWKIKAFEDFDKGTGSDLYILAYARAFDVNPACVSKDDRQIGKVMELALGYGGGAGAFLTFAAAYGMDLDELVAKAWSSIPVYVREQSESMWEWAVQQKRTLGLPQKQFIVCDSLKRMWREAHPAVSSAWGELENIVRGAIGTPGREYSYRSLTAVQQGNWLRLKLPSGQCLCYPSPKIEEGDITYMGMCQYTRKWKRLKTYGGKLFENVCQSGARDVLTSSMPRMEEAGYPIVLSVHDEVITEVPDTTEYNEQELSGILATTPAWAEGLPLAAAGFETYRYRKD